MATRPTNLTVVSQTPVTSYRASAKPVQLKRLHLCRVQPASAIPLEERFPLNTGGFWGYAFSLPESQIYFYQLKAGESFGPLTPRIAFSSSDWAVLTLIATPEIQKSLQDTSSQQPRTRDQETQTPCVFKGAHEFPPFTQQHRPLNAVRKTVTYAQWETKSTPFCRWLCKASRQTAENAGKDEFVLELTNTHSGVFNTLLRIPIQDWLKMVGEKNGRILELFKLSTRTSDQNNPAPPHPVPLPPPPPPQCFLKTATTLSSTSSVNSHESPQLWNSLCSNPSILSASSCFYSSREPRDGSCYSTAESPPGVIISGRYACRFAAPASITSRLELAPPPCSRLAITRTDPGKQPSLRCLALGFEGPCVPGSFQRA
ncbi:transient receptor potential cation channel subfamily M member 7 [Sarotherodon galilaeus]